MSLRNGVLGNYVARGATSCAKQHQHTRPLHTASQSDPSLSSLPASSSSISTAPPSLTSTSISSTQNQSSTRQWNAPRPRHGNNVQHNLQQNAQQRNPQQNFQQNFQQNISQQNPSQQNPQQNPSQQNPSQRNPQNSQQNPQQNSQQNPQHNPQNSQQNPQQNSKQNSQQNSQQNPFSQQKSQQKQPWRDRLPKPKISPEEKRNIITYYKANVEFHANRGDVGGLHEIFKKMKERQIPVSSTVLSRLITALRAQRDVRGVADVYHFVVRTHARIDRVVYNALISQFAEVCDKARVNRLQEIMREKKISADIYTYNALLMTSVKEQDTKGFEELLKRMKEENIEPNVVTYNQHLTLFASMGKRDDFERVRAHMEKEGVNGDRETYHIVMKQYARRGLWEEVTNLLKRMRKEGIDPNVRTYNSLFKYAMLRADWEKCEKMWERIKRIGPSSVSYTQRMRQIAECFGEDSAEAGDVMKEMEADGFPPTAQIYTLRMRIALRNGDPAECQRLFDAMKEQGMVQDHVAYNLVLSAWLISGAHDKAMKVYREMNIPRNRHLIDFTTYDVLLKHLWAQGHEQFVKDVFSDMKNASIKPSADGGAVLLALYAKLQNRQKFRDTYKDMMERQLINQKVYVVVKPYLDREQQEKFEADIALTLKKKQSCVLVGRAQAYTERVLLLEQTNDLQGVKKIVSEMDTKAIPLSYGILSTLVTMLVRAQQWEEAFKIFDQFPARGIFVELPLYELMIRTAAEVQQEKRCEALFADMQKNNVTPNTAILETMLLTRTSNDSLSGALPLYRQLIQLGLPAPEVFHEVLRLCCARNDLPNVFRVISDMRKLQAKTTNPEVSYNCALSVAVKAREAKKCVEIVGDIKRTAVRISDKLVKALRDMCAAEKTGKMDRLREELETLSESMMSQENYEFKKLRKKESGEHVVQQIIEMAARFKESIANEESEKEQIDAAQSIEHQKVQHSIHDNNDNTITDRNINNNVTQNNNITDKITNNTTTDENAKEITHYSTTNNTTNTINMSESITEEIQKIITKIKEFSSSFPLPLSSMSSLVRTALAREMWSEAIAPFRRNPKKESTTRARYDRGDDYASRSIE